MQKQKSQRVLAVLGSLALLAGCASHSKATPQPTGTAAYYHSLSATELKALNYMNEKGVVQLGQIVCENLRVDKSVMWIIRNIITLNGSNDGIDLTADDRYQFAIGVIASATSHLCPDMKDKVITPHE